MEWTHPANNAPRSWDEADPLQKFEAFLKMKDDRDRIHRENRERSHREIFKNERHKQKKSERKQQKQKKSERKQRKKDHLAEKKFIQSLDNENLESGLSLVKTRKKPKKKKLNKQQRLELGLDFGLNPDSGLKGMSI